MILHRVRSSLWGGWNIFRDDIFFRLPSPRASKLGPACALRPWLTTSKRCPLTSANKSSVQSEERVGGQRPNASSCKAGLARRVASCDANPHIQRSDILCCTASPKPPYLEAAPRNRVCSKYSAETCRLQMCIWQDCVKAGKPTHNLWQAGT